VRESGACSSLLLTKVRLTRNLPGIPFSWKASACQKKRIAAVIRPVLGKLCRGKALMLKGPTLAAFLRRFLPSSRAGKRAGLEVWILGDQKVAAIINHLDHLCIQSCHPGLSTGRMLRRVECLGRRLDALMPVARSREWGCLTASPADAGCGIGVSYLADFSALEITGTLDFALSRLCKAGMVCRPHSTGKNGRLWHMTTARPYGLGSRTGLFRTEKALAQVMTIEKAAADIPAVGRAA